jgi:hypothetical protein
MDVNFRPPRLEFFKNPGSLKNIACSLWAASLLFLVARYCAGEVHRDYAFNDYMLAGRHWTHGEYLYGNWRGFIYSPIIAAFFAPFSILFPPGLYTLIQVCSGGLIAVFCIWGRWKAWSIQRVLCGVFFLASIWMTLCGPATEAHTYFIMAPALVIASVKSFHDRQPLSLRVLASGAFLLQIVHPARVSYLIHTKQDDTHQARMGIYISIFIGAPIAGLLPFLAIK